MITKHTLTLIFPAMLFLCGCISSKPSIIIGNEKWFFYSEDSTSPIENTWTQKNDILICTGTPRGYIYTTRNYTDFTLSLEFQRPAATIHSGNNRGGILIRKTGDDKIWPKCLEAQINAPNAGDFVSIGGFKLMSPGPKIKTIEHPALGEILILSKSLDAEKTAGQWNIYEVTAKEGKVTIRINENLVNTAIKCDTAPGSICLTSEGDLLSFRNIVISELK